MRETGRGVAADSTVVAERVLCVDLDGTLVATDVLWESLMLLVRRRPSSLLQLPWWLLRGKAFFKQQVAARVVLDPQCLPYREDVLTFVREQRDRGRPVVLSTGSDRRTAERVAAHLGLFSSVVATDGAANVVGEEKLRAIVGQLGIQEFDYVGNASADLPLWRAAREAILVDPSRRLLRRAHKIARVGRIFTARRNRIRALGTALRPEQWVKNALVFVPLLVGHRITALEPFLLTVAAFWAFSLCASGVYVANDLLDLEYDRRHPRKRHRPFAAGALPLRAGLFLIPLLWVAGFSLAHLVVDRWFTVVLAGYVALSLAYSLYLKRVVIVDVLTLAGLYTIRVIAGGFAADIVLSPWLLAFAVFLFFSLALLKRYAELFVTVREGQTVAGGRDYRVADRSMLEAIGPASGYMAVLVLALYINSDEVTILYRHPQVLWLVSPLLLYWITRMWFLAHRQDLADDPLVFTVKDRVSYALGLVVAALVVLATL